MRLIIAGGRDWAPTQKSYELLQNEVRWDDVEEIVSGCAGYIPCPWDATQKFYPPKYGATDHQFAMWGNFLQRFAWSEIRGADIYGEWWAGRFTPIRYCPANWASGRSAGPHRNAFMARLAAEQDGVCVLFPGGAGTANMHSEATKAGLRIYDWRGI